jgi:hypothetical protein
MNNFTENELKSAHKHSFANRKSIERSNQCGCFCCCTLFPATLVEQWSTERNGNDDTGWCPGCGIDSLIGDSSGISLDRPFLVAMNEKYFDGLCEIENKKVRDELFASFEKALAAKKKSG